MNEEKQYLNNEEITPVPEGEVSPVFMSPESSAEFSGPSAYAAEQHIEINGETAPLEAFEFTPEMATEWELLNPEEKAESIELIQEAALLANVSETGNNAAEKAANISSITTAFALAPNTSPEGNGGDASFETGVEKQSFAQRMLNAVYETAGKGARAAAIAATLGIATLAPMKSAQADFFGSLASQNIQRNINRVDRVMRGTQDVQNIKHQQEDKQMRIDQIERENAELVRRASGDTQVGQIQNTGENRVRNIEIEANYKAQKAELKAQRAQEKANYLRNQNPSEVDEARHEAALARIDAQAARIDAQHEMSQVREDVRVQNTNANIDHAAGNLSDRLNRNHMEQERLRAEIQRLEVQKTQKTWEATRDIAR